MLTGLGERLVTEPCFADLKGVPFVSVECLVYVNDVKVFVHPDVTLSMEEAPGEFGQWACKESRREAGRTHHSS